MQADLETNGTSFPANIRQMGAVDEELRIYMEDYVHTYLYQYARSSATGEKLAVLMGKNLVIDGHETVFVSGVVQARYTEKLKGMETITKKSWKQIGEDIEKYFPDLNVVGWMHSRPSFGAFVTSRDEAYHKKVFGTDRKLFFVVDPIDRTDRFYVLNENRSALKGVRGYFIYYDKNAEMQEYMLQNSLVHPKIKTVEENEEHMDAADKIRMVLNGKQRETSVKTRHKYAAFTVVSAMLCIICVLMSLSIVNSASRINRLENEVVSVKQSVRKNEEKTEALHNDIVSNPVITVMAAENADEKEEEGKEKEEKEKQKIYTVREGDTLAEICRFFYGSTDKLDEIIELNGIVHPDLIFYGTTIVLP